MPDALNAGQSPGFEPLVQLRLRIDHPWLAIAEAVENDRQLAPRHLGRIELLDGAGSGDARVGVKFFAGGGALGVDALKLGCRQIDFASDLDDVRNLGTR